MDVPFQPWEVYEMKRYVQIIVVMGSLLVCIFSCQLAPPVKTSSRPIRKINEQKPQKEDDVYISSDQDRDPIINLPVQRPDRLVGTPLR